MKKLIINADDFGYSRAVNYGILDAYKYGLVTSTTIMSGMPGFYPAVEIAKANLGLGVGVHLTLTCGKPVLNNVNKLVDENGIFKKEKYYLGTKEQADMDQLYCEWDAQIKKTKEAGIDITHLDAHHHAHTFGDNYKIVAELSKKYDLPVRNCFGLDGKLEFKNIKMVDGFWNLYVHRIPQEFNKPYDKLKDIIYKVLIEDLEKFKNKDTVELMCHPAYMDSSIFYGSSFNIPRMSELEMLMDNNIKDIITNVFNIMLCNYKNLYI